MPNQLNSSIQLTGAHRVKTLRQTISKDLYQAPTWRRAKGLLRKSVLKSNVSYFQIMDYF